MNCIQEAHMPVEIIGEVGTPRANPEWISAQATLAIRHIVKVCGPPPPEMEGWKSSGRSTISVAIPRSFCFGKTPCAERRGTISKGVVCRSRLTRVAGSFLPAGRCRPSGRKTTTQLVPPSILTRHRPSHRTRSTFSKTSAISAN